MTDTASHWSAYWRGRGQAGEAFLGEGVEQHPQIAAWWDGVFAEAGAGACVLDLACGAGSVLKRAYAAGLTALTGIDVSEAALGVAREALPDAAFLACSADAVPLPDGSADLVTSQFGFEYAGPGAVAEAGRLLSPNGRLAALVHHAGGAIEAEVAARAEEAEALRETGFVPAARALIEAAFAVRAGGDRARLLAAREAFAGPERALGARLPAGGIGAHLYEGFRTLWARQKAYDLADVTGWLDGMAVELADFEGRMATMRGAARSEVEVEGMIRTLEEGGVAARAEPFTLASDDRPAAWTLTGRRQ